MAIHFTRSQQTLKSSRYTVQQQVIVQIVRFALSLCTQPEEKQLKTREFIKHNLFYLYNEVLMHKYWT